MNGGARMHSVSPAVANFANTRVGDDVSLGIQDARSFVLSGPNVQTPAPRHSTVAAAVGTGQSATGATVSKSIANWWVVGVDPAANTITLVSPNSEHKRSLNMTAHSPDFNPIEQVFAKLKVLLRKLAARSLDALWTAVGLLLQRFPPDECANYFANAGYVPANRNPL